MNPVASALVTERAVAPGTFAISGVAPRFAARPRDREELCELLRAAARDGLAVVPWGGGTALALEPAPERYDLALDLGGLARVVEYQPEDMTLTAECGAGIAALRELLAARGQELPLEGAHAARATLGGVLSANASGPRRRRFGSPRDRILGAHFALGDGTLARTGGKVVKNVAGYGIHRMLCGARGGLAVLVEASLKLLPGPAARTALIYELDPGVVSEARRWQALVRAEPAALTVVDAATAAGAGGAGAALPGATGARPCWLVLGFEDDPPRLAEQAALAEQALGAPSVVLAGGEVEALWQRLADLETLGAARLRFVSAHHAPSALGEVFPDLGAAGGFVFHAACGRLQLFRPAAPVAELVERLAAAGFTLAEAFGIDAEPAVSQAAGVPALRARIRAALDPGSRFALGPRWERLGG